MRFYTKYLKYYKIELSLLPYDIDVMHDVMMLHPRRHFVYYGVRAIPPSFLDAPKRLHRAHALTTFAAKRIISIGHFVYHYS